MIIYNHYLVKEILNMNNQIVQVIKMKKISCICTILSLTAFVACGLNHRQTSVVFPANAQTIKAVTAKNVELVSVTLGPCYAVAVDGNTAYIGAGVYLLILNITDKGSSALLGSVQLPGVVQGIAVSSGYAYVADNYSGLRVVDISSAL
jgi:hypothetical protein